MRKNLDPPIFHYDSDITVNQPSIHTITFELLLLKEDNLFLLHEVWTDFLQLVYLGE